MGAMDGSAEQNIQADRGSLLAAVLKHMRDPAFPKEAFDHWFEHARLNAKTWGAKIRRPPPSYRFEKSCKEPGLRR